jgi:vanillin dehydrogenase
MALVTKEPYGVVVGMAPWNAALFLGFRAVCAPIACGNTVVYVLFALVLIPRLKASEFSPGTHHFIGKIFRDAGFPPGVLNVIQHRREDAPGVVEALVAHPATRKINFTGSTLVGSIVAKLAGQHLKPILLELGGKAPQIVLEDADLQRAAQAAVTGAWLHVVPFFHH